MGSFADELGAQIKAAQDKLDALPGKIALELLASVVRKSPVDTGLFRSSWRVSMNSVDATVSAIATLDALAAGREMLRTFRTADTIYITNSLEYARKLEYGWSKQAPQGMVRLTVAELPDSIRRAVSAL